MKVLVSSVLVLLFGCGSPTINSGDPQLTLGDQIGAQANDARKHLSDRNISGNDVGQGYVDAKEDVAKAYVDGKDETGEQANEARTHMSDRNISSEDVAKGYTTARNDTGAEANRARDYAFARGVDEMRNGDSDAQTKIDDLDDRASSAEARLTALEALSKVQGRMSEILADRSSIIEAALSSNEQDRQSIRSSIADLSSSTDSRVASIVAAQQALSDALAANGAADDDDEAASQNALADLTLALAQTNQNLSDLDDELSAKIRNTNRRLAQLSRQQQRINARQDRQIRNLRSVVRSLDRRLNDAETNISDLQSDLSTLENAVSDIESSVTALENAPDLYCSVSQTTTWVSYRDYWSHHNYNVRYIQISVPVVNCPNSY